MVPGFVAQSHLTKNVTILNCYLHTHLSLAEAHLMEFDRDWCLAVTGGGSVGKCGRLSQPSWLLGAL